MTGPTFSRPFVDHGDNTRLAIRLTATDRTGARADASFTALPLLRTLTIASSAPATFTVNGVERTIAEATVGSNVSIIAVALPGTAWPPSSPGTTARRASGPWSCPTPT